MSEIKRILVLGGGFAGVECVRKLESYFPNENDIQITLVSGDNFFLFTPMLPQVASGTIETRHIVIPVRTLLKKTKFYEVEVKNIDPYGKTVTLSGTKEKRGISLHYDYLVLALGSQTNFFGMDQLAKLAYSMKTLNDAVVLRNRAIDMLEQADNETNPILKKSLLTFVIVGGGFAGIETAGELMDLLHDARKYYPNIEKTNFVSPDAINFMAKHGRGLICLTLPEERCRQLNLPPMVAANRSSHGTNFTVSIEAASG